MTPRYMTPKHSVNPTRGDPWDRSELFVEATPWIQVQQDVEKCLVRFSGPQCGGETITVVWFPLVQNLHV